MTGRINIRVNFGGGGCKTGWKKGGGREESSSDRGKDRGGRKRR